MRRLYFSFFFVTLLFLTACGQPEITAQAVAEEPILLGANFPMTGRLSVYGQPLFEGFSLAVEEINNAGGINGMQIELILEDNGGEPTRAVVAAQKLIESDKIRIQISTMVGPTGAIVPITESVKSVLLYAAASGEFAEQNKYVFKDSVDAKYDCEVLAKEAVNGGMRRIALFGAIGEFTVDCKESIEKVLAKEGGELVKYEAYERGATDFRTPLIKIKASEPDVIFLSTYADDCLLIWRQVKELNVRSPFMLPFTQTGCGEAKAMSEVKDSQLTITGLDFISDAASKEYQTYITNYRAKYGKEPSLPVFTMLAYDWAHYIAKALEQCPGASDSECLKNALEQTKHTGALGYVEYSTDHVALRPRKLIEWKDGEWRGA